MGLTRVIHPIGQGGFYTETFTDKNNELFNMVYDCGSETDKSRHIVSYLNKYISGSKKSFDAVFISHLHNDHINGLDYLLQNTTVRNLFLPQLTPDMIIEAYIYNYIKAGTFDSPSNDCITNIIHGTYNKTRIVEIIESNGDERYNRTDDVIIGNHLYSSYPSGTVFTVNGNAVCPEGKCIKWLYIPFNSPCPTKNGKTLSQDPFFSSIKDENGVVDRNKIAGIIKSMKIDECKKIYKDYYGRDHNAYSMTLFSGLKRPKYCNYCRYYHCEYHGLCYCVQYPIHRSAHYDCSNCDCRKICLPNCLYTGDFKAKEFASNLKAFYSPLWNTISYIQVPHHGSRNNYHPDLYDSAMDGFISAGKKNSYHHPNRITLFKIRRHGCHPIVVTEDPSTKIVQHFPLF